MSYVVYIYSLKINKELAAFVIGGVGNELIE